MPATPQFAEPHVLARAMETFLDEGYAGASLHRLRAATGLKSGSLYNSFASKRGLFLRVIDFYVETIVSPRVARYLDDTDPGEGLRAFFVSAADYALTERRTCLLANAALELGGDDRDVSLAIGCGLDVIRTGFQRLLGRAGVPEQRRASRSDRLLAAYCGIMVMARSGLPAWRIATMTDDLVTEVLA